jgi:hypothetical protein
MTQPFPHHPTYCPIVLAFAAIASISHLCVAQAQSPSAEDLKFFETKIRPVLVKNCYACHSKQAKEVGGKLLLDSRDGLRSGGESGPALVDGKPDESLLIQALLYDGLQMPPEKPLSESVIQDLKEWVRRGAPDPRQPKEVRRRDGSSVTSDEPLWSLQPRQIPATPDVRDVKWSRDPLDLFVLARIEAAKLSPARDVEPDKLAANELTYWYAGRDHRLTGPEGGRVVHELFA